VHEEGAVLQSPQGHGAPLRGGGLTGIWLTLRDDALISVAQIM